MSSQDEASATTGKEPKTSKQGNSVHSGPNKKITDNVKDGPSSNKTGNDSNAKHGPKMKHTSKKAPRRKYYRPSDDTKTFQINNKGHLQCLQDPKLIHRPNDKGKLPGSREAPIYHEPGTVSCKTVEDLKKLYPNSFDRLGSLKGAYNIRIDKGSKSQVQAENANAPRKSSDSENRLQDIQEEPRRRIWPSCVKELAKFFTPTSDEEENSRVNNRTRRKKLFEPKREEESEK